VTTGQWRSSRSALSGVDPPPEAPVSELLGLLMFPDAWAEISPRQSPAATSANNGVASNRLDVSSACAAESSNRSSQPM